MEFLRHLQSSPAPLTKTVKYTRHVPELAKIHSLSPLIYSTPTHFCSGDASLPLPKSTMVTFAAPGILARSDNTLFLYSQEGARVNVRVSFRRVQHAVTQAQLYQDFVFALTRNTIYVSDLANTASREIHFEHDVRQFQIVDGRLLVLSNRLCLCALDGTVQMEWLLEGAERMEATPEGILVGGGGRVWLVREGGVRSVEIAEPVRFLRFPLVVCAARAFGLSVGPDGSLGVASVFEGSLELCGDLFARNGGLVEAVTLACK
ncbi:hypothetical protein SS50377_24131 [Spironucleus salmonicida]|uniref:Uncharacterized protein n=1 Tax=Spironucleus salmonicida TaxID=348837 RepID=V6LK28_9EUKA|nr:hypothetical protein SS50377_24131 [Spironucleus salmonicida]|eukprot:EST44091.1 Hypothetical protein SS50377_16090 [Spironucleus salmonicida]